jgi:uncharacterized membrane protein YphA (DoxX/SURF4 family)
MSVHEAFTAYGYATGMEHAARAWNVMRFAYGAVLVLAGLDKFGTNLIVEWATYISPFVSAHLPVSVPVFLGIMGVIEIAVGILFFTRWSHVAGYLSVVWLVLISVNLLMLGLKDIAIRDLLLAVGAYAIAELSYIPRRADGY